LVSRVRVGEPMAGAMLAAPVPPGEVAWSLEAALSLVGAPAHEPSALAPVAPPNDAPTPAGASTHGSVTAATSAETVSNPPSAAASGSVGTSAVGSVATAPASEGSVTVSPMSGSSAAPTGLLSAGSASAAAVADTSAPVGSSVVGGVTSTLTDSACG